MAFFRNGEFRPSLGVACLKFLQGFVDEVEGGCCRIRLEIRPRAIAFDGIAPLGNLPLELRFGEKRSLRQIDFHAVASCFDVADVDEARERGRPESGDWAASGIERQVISSPLVVPPRGHDPGIFALEIALLRLGRGGLVPGMPFVHRVAKRVSRDECFSGLFPVVVVRTTQQNSDSEIDIDEVIRHELSVYNHAGRDEHSTAPVAHVLVGVVADIRVVERAPAAQQNAALADFFVPRQRLVEKIEQIVVQRNNLLHELHIFHQPDEVVGEKLNRGHRADAAGIKRRRMHVPAFHQAEHLARHAAHLQRFAIELAGERIERLHDVGDGTITVLGGIRSGSFLGLIEHARVRFLHHLFAEIDADQVVLEDVVIEHVLGGFAQIEDPLAERRRFHAEGHVLRVYGASGVVVATDAANSTCNKVGVPRIFALHKDAIPAKDRRSAVTLGDLPIIEIDLGENAQASYDSSNGIPIHLHQVSAFGDTLGAGLNRRGHFSSSFLRLVRLRPIAGGELGAGMAPLGFVVHSGVCQSTQRSYCLAIRTDQGGGKAGARRFIHKRHELVGEAGHGAADADASNVGTTANPAHPAALGHVAIHDRTPAAEFHEAAGGAILLREVSLFVVTTAVAAFVNRFPEEPSGTQLVIERDHGRATSRLIDKV